MKKNNSSNKHTPSYSNITDSKIYMGIVKNNNDVQKMGRLEVFIPEFGGDPQDSSRWFVVSYASPFAGTSNIESNMNGSTSMAGSQVSYGMWMIPPHLNNQVLVLFLNGEPSRGVWFACLWQQNMNHMVPGVASNLSFQDGVQGILPPVTEYNKRDSSVSTTDPRRPRFDPLHKAFMAQGLYSDFERGPTDASARRESPSNVFGISTPRSNHIYMDDDQTNEYIRLRTRGGVQVLLHETNGYVYINSGDGNSWVEISDAGIDMFSAGNISVRSEQDINFRADRNINLDAGESINIKAGLNLLQNAGTGIHFTAGEIISDSSPTLSSKAENIFRDGMIYDNTGNAIDSPTPTTYSRADRKGSINVTLSRMPTHEPFAGHPRSKNISPPQGDVPGQDAAIKGLGDQLTDVPPNTAKESVVQTVAQKTGEGETKEVQYDENKDAPKVKVGAHNVSEAVLAAIRRASEVAGVDFGFMMAMAEKESSFDPNARPINKKTGQVYSSAQGLYQIINGTWSVLYKNYGEKYNIPNNRYDPYANALMAAFLTKENTAAMRKYGVKNPGDPTSLYMAHFAGPFGAAKLLTATNPSASGVSVVGQKAADANPWVFYSKGSPKSVGSIISYFKNFIEPRTVAYRSLGNVA